MPRRRFRAWKSVQIRFRERDLARIPPRCLQADSRAVPTGTPRAATSPINALRNYLFACLESEARPSTPVACAMCGEPVLKRRRRHCEACMPNARREHGLRAIKAARKALAAQAAAGNDPRRSPAVNRARGEAISDGLAAIEVGRASIRASGTRPGSSVRSCRSSMRSRSKRSARRPGYRSRPARASGRARRFLIHGTGTACSHCSKPGTEAPRRTPLAADAFLHRGARENEELGTESLRLNNGGSFGIAGGVRRC